MGEGGREMVGLEPSASASDGNDWLANDEVGGAARSSASLLEATGDLTPFWKGGPPAVEVA